MIILKLDETATLNVFIAKGTGSQLSDRSDSKAVYMSEEGVIDCVFDEKNTNQLIIKPKISGSVNIQVNWQDTDGYVLQVIESVMVVTDETLRLGLVKA